MELKTWLKDDVLVIAQVGDTDACACFVIFKELAKKLNPKAKLEFSVLGLVNKEGQKIFDDFKFKLKKPDINEFDKILLVDTQPNALPDGLKKKDLFVIDHHQKTGDYNGIIDANSSAAAVILYDLAEKYKIKLSENSAKAVCFAIMADTAGLRFASSKTLKALSELLDNYSFDYQKLIAEFYIDKEVAERLAWLKAGQRAEIKVINSNKILVISRVGGFESSAASKLIGLGADIVLVVSRKPQETRIVGRAKPPVNLGEIFIKTSEKIAGTGGGHPGAAVLNLPADKEKDALEFIIKKLQE